MVKHIFITFRYKDLTIEINEVFDTLKTIEKNMSIVGIVEIHENGHKHYHILLIIKHGVSKNTYRNQIRSLFPIMKGHGLDIRGVRNIKYTVKYILKDVTDTNNIKFYNIRLDEFLKLRGRVELCVYFSILNFTGGFEE
jgi:hypothetical protein